MQLVISLFVDNSVSLYPAMLSTENTDVVSIFEWFSILNSSNDKCSTVSMTDSSTPNKLFLLLNKSNLRLVTFPKYFYKHLNEE